MTGERPTGHPGWRPPRPKTAASAALAVAAAAMLAYRFVDLDRAPFINDEPVLMMAAERQIERGSLPAAGVIGTRGITYGPIAIWFYTAVHALFGPDPLWSIAAVCLLLTAAHVALAVRLAAALKGGVFLGATVLALLAGSPYLFYWSRLAWDSPIAGALACLAVALLAAEEPPRARWHVLSVGVLLGSAVGIHLKMVPLAALVTIVLLVEGRRTLRATAVSVALIAAGMILVNMPYLLYLARAPIAPHGSASTFSPRSWVAHLFQPARVASAWGIEYFFDDAWPDFMKWLGAAGHLLRLSSLGVGFTAALALVGIVVSLRSDRRGPRRLAILATTLWALQPLLWAAAGLPFRHPQYQQSVVWVVPFGVAAAIAWLRVRRPALGGWAAAAVWICSLAQFALIVSWVEYSRARDGVQGGFGTPLGSQRRAVKAACAEPAGPIVLINETRLFPVSLRYLVDVEAACAGREVIICAPRRCPEREDARRLRLRYAGPSSGALRLEAAGAGDLSLQKIKSESVNQQTRIISWAWW